jgi:superfamily II DNA or RNA helicase
LRAWQREALARFEASDAPTFLAVATPGAGKTAFALTAVRRSLLARQTRRFVVVVPTQHLKTQWAQIAERFDLHVDPAWSAGYGALPSDVHGVVVTYQQVAANPGALRPLVHGAMVVLDEIHHAGESRSWGDGVRVAFEPATRRLCLSGTPFRSDQNTIPFIRYSGIEAQPDYEYGYGEALNDRAVVRPVYFPRIKGHMEWSAPGGLDYAATFDDPLTRELANQRLRTALDGEGEWLASVLAQAHAQLHHLRQRDGRAAGMVIAMDQDHARAIASIMHERLGLLPVVATSDDPTASRKIGDFAAGVAPWIVAVRMVSEGVDIPRLRVGVFATNTLTELFFRQAVGRLVRWTGGQGRQTAYMFIPDDPRLRLFAAEITKQRRHSVRPGAEFEAPPDDGERQQPANEIGDEDQQLSLFTAISAVPLDEDGRRFDGVRVYDEPANEAGDEDGVLIPDMHGGATGDSGASCANRTAPSSPIWCTPRARSTPS